MWLSYAAFIFADINNQPIYPLNISILVWAVFTYGGRKGGLFHAVLIQSFPVCTYLD